MQKQYLILDISGVLITQDKWGNTKTNKELIAYLLTQKDKFSYVLLTNNLPEVERHMEAVYGIPMFYERFISSHTYGLAKSDPKLYDEVLALLLATPEQCTFTDDIAPHVEAARTLGIRGIVYQNFEQFKKELESM